MRTSSIINLETPLQHLFSKDVAFIEKLSQAGIKKIKDLLWIFPLHRRVCPPVSSFSHFHEGQLFKGRGRIIHWQSKPLYGRRKSRFLLYNLDITIQDIYSQEILNLHWFNAYFSQKKRLENLKLIEFTGEARIFLGKKQIINPKVTEILLETPVNLQPSLIIEYPAVHKISGTILQKVINKIPAELWDNIPEFLPENLLKKHQMAPLSLAFKTFHGQIQQFSETSSLRRLIYQEFLEEQVRIYLRRQHQQSQPSVKFNLTEKQLLDYLKIFPFSFTKDQLQAVENIRHDLNSGHPMMRLLQGDVGSGKTAVALMASIIVMENNGQVALMCPTESLAWQHYQNFNIYLKNTSFKFEILLGSTSTKEKKIIHKNLIEGQTQLVIGTHSLLQDKVQFKKLNLVIIDEQHKFGVEQRVKLSQKNEGVHSLIMTATPIPRSLSLTQYGDLDISTLREFPSARKGAKSRIVIPENFNKFLSFLKTRLELGDQAYIVVPSIEENEELDLKNLTKTVMEYSQYFPEIKIESLHGKMKTDEKFKILSNFSKGKIPLLISTSVVEVGIDVANASVMAVLNPERFGLSSLHQLRGRVGRSHKPGFFFMITDKHISIDSLERLKIVEKSSNGFDIAEADLKIRGKGDLFGKDQSGMNSQRKIAHLVDHYDLLQAVREDLSQLIKSPTNNLSELLTFSTSHILPTV